jgi:hypothetical protein
LGKAPTPSFLEGNMSTKSCRFYRNPEFGPFENDLLITNRIQASTFSTFKVEVHKIRFVDAQRKLFREPEAAK